MALDRNDVCYGFSMSSGEEVKIDLQDRNGDDENILKKIVLVVHESTSAGHYTVMVVNVNRGHDNYTEILDSKTGVLSDKTSLMYSTVFKILMKTNFNKDVSVEEVSVRFTSIGGRKQKTRQAKKVKKEHIKDVKYNLKYVTSK